MAEKFGSYRWVKEGYLDNRTSGLVVGRISFAAIGSVEFCLKGDFRPDIAGHVIVFKNSLFSEDPVAENRMMDFTVPQLGTVSLISFDPHPLLEPHPYFEWFSLNEEHYRIELAPADAWIVEGEKANEFNEASQGLVTSLAPQLEVPRSEKRTSEQEWF